MPLTATLSERDLMRLTRRHEQSTNQSPVPTDRTWVQRIASQLLVAVGLTLSLLVAQSGAAMAHTGDDAEFKHVVIEFALWGVGLAAAIVLLVVVFWVRAKLLRRST